jgi:hypothetical protein
MSDDSRPTMEPSFASGHRESSLSSFAWPYSLVSQATMSRFLRTTRAKDSTQDRCHPFRIDLSGALVKCE